ncbi:MAG TPA: lipoate--protein ligase family protein [Bacillota bacterium]|jgi:octanoyl-[GcvH]:protein N-octanoyltransferase|nr:lipoate--protein ligase family protein [Bacillota bacterium]
MKHWEQVISQQTFRYLDCTEEKNIFQYPNDAILSFAIDDALAASVSNGESDPVMRLWVHPKTIVLGIPDSKLPFLSDGVAYLDSLGYDVIIRNSGGLAVALDEGVLNLSLVIPGEKLSIYDCYEAMVSFVQSALKDLTSDIEAYEIVGSYCPGDYDLSIGGKKFAGISQRRIKEGTAVQIYLDVEGNTKERAAVIREFYKRSKQNKETKFVYPEVRPEVMASLSELLQMNLTVSEMKKRVFQALADVTEQITMTGFTESEWQTFEKRYAQMLKRNEPIRTILGR